MAARCVVFQHFNPWYLFFYHDNITNYTFVLPMTPWPYFSDVVVHVGSAKGACSLGPGSTRVPIVFISGPYPWIYEFDHGTHTGFVETIYVRAFVFLSCNWSLA